MKLQANPKLEQDRPEDRLEGGGREGKKKRRGCERGQAESEEGRRRVGADSRKDWSSRGGDESRRCASHGQLSRSRTLSLGGDELICGLYVWSPMSSYSLLLLLLATLSYGRWSCRFHNNEI